MKSFLALAVGALLLFPMLLAGCGGGGDTSQGLASTMDFSRATKRAHIYSTDSAGIDQINVFAEKTDVYLNSKTATNNSEGLIDGAYYCKVTVPGGDLLGKSDGAVITITDGTIPTLYHLWDIVFQVNPDGTFMMNGDVKVHGFADSRNNEYKIWISRDPDFSPSESKTDNFHVNAAEAQNPPELTVQKFYDANANGIDDDNQPITGWKVNISDDLGYDRFTPVIITLAPNTYTVLEYRPIETNWMATTPESTTVELNFNDQKTVSFGNLCLGAGGGHSLGFWANRNGQALIDADDLAALTALNLRNANGSAFDPTTKAQVSTWLLLGKAPNMAFMLSVQLAAMELSVSTGAVNPNALIYAPNTGSANALGFATVGAIIAEADAELAQHPTALAGDAWRTLQEALKNALDQANNNKTFVQPTPGVFTFPI